MSAPASPERPPAPLPSHADALAAGSRTTELAPERPGERPGRDEGFDYDYGRHMASYHYAATLAPGLKVLDAGCGDGFGSQYLAAVAREVVGVDHSEVAVAQCRRLWLDGTRDNLRFEVLDLARPRGLDERFDLIANIQVFEHISDPLPFLEGLRDRLAPGGTLVISTPNLLRSVSENPFHVKEYTATELAAVLGRVFGRVDILGLHGNDKVEAFEAKREKAVRRILALDPLGIRHLLPRSVVEFAFAHLARLVRRQASPADDGRQGIVPEDFHVDAARIDRAVDLIALCRHGDARA